MPEPSSASVRRGDSSWSRRHVGYDLDIFVHPTSRTNKRHRAFEPTQFFSDIYIPLPGIKHSHSRKLDTPLATPQWEYPYIQGVKAKLTDFSSVYVSPSIPPIHSPSFDDSLTLTSGERWNSCDLDSTDVLPATTTRGQNDARLHSPSSNNSLSIVHGRDVIHL